MIDPVLHSPEVALAGIKARVKDRYDLYGSDPTPTHKKDATWTALARELAARVIEPMDFIDAQFRGDPDRYRDPTPEHLLKPKAFERYHQYLQTSGYQIVYGVRIYWNCQKAQLAREISFKKVYGKHSLEDAQKFAFRRLFDDWWPLFRYVNMIKIGKTLEDWARRREFAHAAIQYVLRSAVFDEACGDDIPQDFKGEAMEAYRLMFPPMA